jgi:hypothetical protein
MEPQLFSGGLIMFIISVCLIGFSISIGLAILAIRREIEKTNSYLGEMGSMMSRIVKKLEQNN